MNGLTAIFKPELTQPQKVIKEKETKVEEFVYKTRELKEE